jgi:hypothetical protein
MNLSRRFIAGLAELGLTYNDIKKWSYCGGKSFSNGENQLATKHEKYFKQCYPNADFPKQQNKCICDQDLIHNCYIRENIFAPIESILIVGQCCIEKFIDNGIKKICERCESQHNNRTNNICNDCRKIEKAKERDIQKIKSKTYYDIPYAISNTANNKCILYNNKCKWNSEFRLWVVNNDTDDLQDEFEEKIITDQDLRKNVLDLFLPLSTRMTYLYEFSKIVLASKFPCTRLNCLIESFFKL